MRQDSTSQRGSATVIVLVITLMLLLTFVVLWFMEKGDHEKAVLDKEAAVKQEQVATSAATKMRDILADTSRLLGDTTKPLADLLDDQTKQFGGGVVVSDLAAVQAQLTPDGMVPVAGGATEPGALNWLRQNTSVDIQSDTRTSKTDNVTESKADFGWMTPEFKAKLKEYEDAAKAVPPVPAMPVDSDDVTATAEYAANMKQYEEKLAAFRKIGEELAAMEGYKKFLEVIKVPGAMVDEAGMIKLNFFTETPTAVGTMVDLLKEYRKPIVAMRNEIINGKTSDAKRVSEVTAEKASLETSLADLKKQLEEEQARHTTDVANLQKEVAAANAKVEENRLTATTAINQAAKTEEDLKRAEAKAAQDIHARDQRILADKAKRDLAIRRDDKDGDILTSSPSMRTGTINLGSMDKVFAGLKFNVSAYGRGGIRETKGQVMVLRVLGDHSAQVTILAQDPARPIVQGDMVSNPLYSPIETIHVYFAGDLERYPKSIAKERLGRMGVVVDDVMSGQTDYVVVPNSMQAAAAAPPAEGGAEGGAAPAAGQGELEKLESKARTFGAQVITEELLNSFLDY